MGGGRASGAGDVSYAAVGNAPTLPSRNAISSSTEPPYHAGSQSGSPVLAPCAGQRHTGGVSHRRCVLTRRAGGARTWKRLTLTLTLTLTHLEAPNLHPNPNPDAPGSASGTGPSRPSSQGPSRLSGRPR